MANCTLVVVVQGLAAAAKETAPVVAEPSSVTQRIALELEAAWRLEDTVAVDSAAAEETSEAVHSVDTAAVLLPLATACTAPVAAAVRSSLAESIQS